MVQNANKQKKLHVLVVGAGPAGLAACRQLLADPEHFTFKCCERSYDIGGTWLHTDTPDESRHDDPPKDEPYSHQSFIAYDGLRTNLPAILMAYPDFPFQPEHITEKSLTEEELLWIYPTQYDILNYFRAYTDHFSLRPHIVFNAHVDSIRRAADSSEEAPKFNAVSHCIKTGKKTTEIFDAVIVCNGHYGKPNWPVLENLSVFKGRYIHCKSYRNAKQFSDCKKIVFLGGAISGPDIALDILRSAPDKEIIVAAHNPWLLQKEGGTLKGIKQIRIKTDVAGIDGPRSVRFVDGSVENDVDVLIATTGFHYDFPFLSKEDGLEPNCVDRRCELVYKQCVHVDQPNLFFVGLHNVSLGFSIMDLQCRYALALLRGEFKLPPRAEMLEWEEKDLNARSEKTKWPRRHAYKLTGFFVKSYNDALVKESGIESLDDLKMRIFARVAAQIPRHPESFRRRKYRDFALTVEDDLAEERSEVFKTMLDALRNDGELVVEVKGAKLNDEIGREDEIIKKTLTEEVAVANGHCVAARG